MTNVIISPTLHEEKRLEAISYFSRCSEESALKIHKKNKYRDIKLRLKRDILVTVLLLRLYYSVK